MITHAGIGHLYHTKDNTREPTLVVTRIPWYVYFIEKADTVAHRYTRWCPPLHNVLCWLLCKRNDAALDLWCWRKTQHFSMVVTDEQAALFRETFR